MREWAPHVRPRLSSLRLTPVRENEIVEELSQHLEDRWRELVTGGTGEDEAARLALAELGEGTLLARLAPLRQAHMPSPIAPGLPRGRLLQDCWQDLRYAARTLRKQPAFTLAAVLTLALGIGANTAIFSVVNAVLLQPLPYPEASRLVVIGEQRPAPMLKIRLSAENFLDLQRDARSFDAVGAYTGNGFSLTGRGDPQFVVGQMISAELLDALGVKPLIGRPFRADENEGGRDQVMLLSYGLWQRRYGGDRDIVGQTITANGKPYTVVGVMPPAFEFPQKRYELWVPFAFRNNQQGMVNRGAHFLQVVGRLRRGVSPAEAQAELTTIAARLEAAYPGENAHTTFRTASLAEETVGEVRTALLLVLSAVGFVLLIGCANVTNLLLARASTRERELAVRAALGASRARLMGQLLTETLALYAAGACTGIGLAAWGLDALIALSPGNIPRLDRTHLDLTTLGFTLGVTLLTGLVFGMVPALHSAYRAPAEHLKARSTTAGRATRRARAALVAAEVALSLMLMVGAGLAGRSLVQLERVDTGLNAEGVLTFDLVPPETSYGDGTRVRDFHREVIERLSRQPGIVAVGATTHLPLSGQNLENGFTPEGWTPPTAGQEAVSGLRGIGGRYFDAIGARLVSGRTFTDDDRAGSQLVVMVNEEFARRYWPGQDAVGKRLKPGDVSSDAPWRLVVGVYASLKHMGPEAETRPEVLYPYAQTEDEWVTRWMRAASVVMRTTGDPASLVAAARGTIRSIDASVPLVQPRPMTALVSDSVAQPRFRSTLLLSFAGLALLLALVGIYGVVAFDVEQRMHEISVRVALGARRASVLGLIVRQGSTPVVIGVMVGLAGAVAVGRGMRGLLFQVQPADPLTFVAMPLLLGVVALVACVVPARRALAVDPAQALLAE
ncbi:MAG TPA: ABC transporter permease [Vicinamibacterales bacterium]|jgi:putative ABC transport system permease protein|nr:ABC transporter permease [Vicinamibacterales bacterium]